MSMVVCIVAQAAVYMAADSRQYPSGRDTVQKVFLVGPDGKSYVAVYSLQRQPDGSWRINGCTLVEDSGATI